MPRTSGLRMAVSQPGNPPCGVSNQDALAHALEEGAQDIEFFCHIVRADIGCHLSEKLVQGILVRRELYSRVECGPFADPEDVEPELLVGKRPDGGFRRRSARPSPSWEVNQVGGVSFAQEHVIKALPSVRCCLPAPGGLSIAMNED